MTIGASATTVSGRISVVGDLQAGSVPQTIITTGRAIQNVTSISSGPITASGSSVFNPTSDMVIVNEPSTNTDLQTVMRVGTSSGGLFLTTDNAIIGKGAYYDGSWIATSTTGASIDFTANNRITFNTFSGATVGGAAAFGARAYIDASGLNVTGTISSGRLSPTGIQMSVDTGLYNQNASLSYYASTNAVYLNGAGPSGWLRLNAAGTENDTNAINIFGSNNGANITFKTAGTQRMNIDSGGNLRWGSANTAILDPSRNLTNIGTISSGAITSSGQITAKSAVLTDDGSGSPLLKISADDNAPWAIQLYREDLGGGPQVFASNTTTWSFQGHIDLRPTYAYKVDGTTVIDSSRNLTNIASISSSGNITGAALLIDGNTAVDKSGTNYMVFHDGGGAPALYAGNTSDNRNYYQSNHHRFRSDDANTNFAEIGSLGMIIGDNGPEANMGKLHVKDSDSGATPYQSGNGGITIERNGRAALNFLTPSSQDAYVFFGDPQSANAGYVGYEHANDVLVLKSAGYVKTSGSGLNISAGYLQMGGTGVIDGNRNITAGSISSGAITSSGKLEVNQAGNGTSNVPSDVAEFSGQSSGGVLKALSLVNSVSGLSGNGTEIAFHNASNYSPTGTVRVIQAGDHVTDSKMVLQIYRSGLKDAVVIDHDEKMTVGGAITAGGAVTAGNGSTSLGYYVGTTQVIQGSTRNLVNIGTITAGLTKLTPSGYSTAPQGHAALNIGRAGSGETRAIDIWGSWNNGESKSITFNHGSSLTQMVGQINCVHSPSTNIGGSSFRWGKLYHGGDSSTYTMELHSESQTLANLYINTSMVQIGHDATYSNYGVIGFGGRANGNNRVFAHNGTTDGLFLASATGHGIYMRPNGGTVNKLTVAASGQVQIAQGDIILNSDGTYGANYGTIGFGGYGNGYNRIFARNSTADGLYLAAATGAKVKVRANGSAADTLVFGYDDSYSGYASLGFGGGLQNGYNRIFASTAAGDGIYITAATGRQISFRVNGQGTDAFKMDSQGRFVVGSTIILDQSRNLTNIGKATFSGSGAYNSPTLSISVTGSGAYIHASNTFASSMTGGNFVGHFFGKAGSTKNSGYVGYVWSADASDNNYVSLGHWGNNHLLRLYADGDLNINDGGLQIGGTTVIDTSRNLISANITNQGTMSSGSTTLTANYTGGSGDYTNIGNPPLKIVTSSGYARVPVVSAHSSISIVHNFETAKDVYWGEPNDTGVYYFRGRNFYINNGNTGIGVTPNSSYKLYVGGNIAQSSGSIYAFGDVVIGQGGLKRGSTTLIDASRNLTNIASATVSGTLYTGGGTPTGSTIGTVRAYGSTSAYMGASDAQGRTAFFGVDGSGYAMFGALTNHHTVIRANNGEKLRIQTNGVINIAANGVLAMNGTTVIDASRNIFFGAGYGETLRLDRAQSAADYDAIHIAYTGSWSNYQERLAGINVTDNTNSANTVGRFGITYGSGGGSFVVTDLYDGGYGASGDVFRVRGTGVVEITNNLIMSGTTVIDSSRQLINCSAGNGSTGLKFATNNWFFSTDNIARLYFSASSATFFRSANHWYFQNNSGANQAQITDTGNAIFNGNVTAYGTVSDIRLKENIQRIADPIDKVKQLDGITFDYKKDGSRSTGLIAQQLLEVLPEVVYEEADLDSGDTHYAVRYGQVVGLLVEAIKDQQEQIDSLKDIIKEMTDGNN